MPIDARDLDRWCPDPDDAVHEPCTYGENLRRLLNMNYDKSYQARGGPDEAIEDLKKATGKLGRMAGAGGAPP